MKETSYKLCSATEEFVMHVDDFQELPYSIQVKVQHQSMSI